MSKKRLGRDLGSLLSSTTADTTDAAVADSTLVPVTDIRPSPYQPRRQFDDVALGELAESIKTQGLLQPVVVRPSASGGFELIAGERRWRAAQLAGLEAIPTVQRQVTDSEASALALIENMQREDLNALEEAMGLARLRDEFELTQQEIADTVGKSRVAIANLLRLLNLGAVAKELLGSGELDMGHARALLAIDGIQQDQIAREISVKGLSVRQTEALVKRLSGAGSQKKKKAAPVKDPDTQRIERSLTERLGAPVDIKHGNGGRGSVVISYTSLDELDGVLERLGVDTK